MLTSARGRYGAEFLRRLRHSLTAWYGAVLVATLVLAGLIFYFGLQDLLMRPAIRSLRAHAEFTARRWEQTSSRVCSQARDIRGGFSGRRPPRGFVERVPVYIVCVDPDGRVAGAVTLPGGAAPPESFLRTLPADRVARYGVATDLVDGGDGVGTILRVAVVAVNAATGAPLGIVQAGRSVEPQASVLRLARDLLLALGVAAVLVATAGGMFLSGRALAPARLALERQQTFVADASHELRTPLTLIRANAEVLLRGRSRLDPADAGLVDDIVTEVGHMDRLVTSLLTLASLDAGQPSAPATVLDLSAAAASVVKRLAPLVREKAVVVTEDYGGDTVVRGEPEALEQVALILLENAVKYTPAGGSIAVRTTSGEGGVCLTVEDEGVGIPAEELPRVGERFYRVDRARARETGGAGLGLAIARQIAAAHKGSVQVTSAPGRGTRATLTLPAADRAAPPA